jgi:hypothetical protein
MGKKIRRTATVTYSETWTVTWKGDDKDSPDADAAQIVRNTQEELEMNTDSVATDTLVKNFTGSFAGEENDNLVFPTMTVDGEVTGEATHLGRFTYYYNAVVNMADLTATETAKFVAANGSIYAEGHATATVVEDPWLSTITEQMIIKGGTGRFEGVTGSYTIHRTATAPSDQTTTKGTFEGTIVMPKGGLQ